MSDIQIRRLTQEHNADMLALYNVVFNRAESDSFWITKHYTNPYGDSVFWGAFSNDELVAMNGFMPLQFVWNDKTYNVLISCESAVSEQFRHRGLFSRIIREAEKWAQSQGFDFMIGIPNMNSYPGFVKLGWETVGRAIPYGRIVNFRRWAGAQEKGRPVANVILFMNHLRNCITGSRKNDITVQKINEKEFEALQSTHDIHCNYSYEYLHWKCRPNNISLFKVIDLERVVLLAACNDTQILLVDFLDTRTDRRHVWLRVLTEEVFRDAPVAEIIDNDRILSDEILSQAGFVSRRLPPYHRILKRLSPRALAEIVPENVIIHTLEEG